MMMLMWILLILLPLSNAYTISYLDCNAPQRVHRYIYETICKTNPTTNTTAPKRYQLLQRVDKSEIAGHSCSIVKSTFLLYCGAYSHSKLMKIPDIEVTQPLEADECRKLLYSRKYTAADGNIYPLKLQEETLIKSMDLGVITEGDNSVSCEGQEVQIAGHVIKDAVQVSQIKITLLQEKYQAVNSRIEVVRDHLRLPRECKKMTGGCITAERTYIWTAPSSRCNLEKVQELDLTQVGKYLVDHGRKVLLRPGDSFPAPGRCPSVKLTSTEYNEFYLAPAEAAGFTPLTDEVEIDIFSRSLTDYSLYEAERLFEENSEAVRDNLCKHEFLFNDDRIHKLDGNSFASRKGDTVYLFECTERGGVIKQEKHCFKDIPIEGGGFVNSLTRVYQNDSSPTTCNKHFPLEIRTKQGWVSINPEIKEVSKPEDKHLEHYKTHHEDLAKGGLYTGKELTSWRQHLEDGSYTDAIMGTIAYGTCINSGQCPPGGGNSRINFDLTRLNPLSDIEEELNVWHSVEKWLTKHVAILCCLVLALEAFKLLTTVVIIITTFTKEGFAGLKAMLIFTFCSAYTTYRKIRRRGKRMAMGTQEENIPMTTVETLNE